MINAKTVGPDQKFKFNCQQQNYNNINVVNTVAANSIYNNYITSSPAAAAPISPPRIHLAVKPFPCEFCNKEFSRKDALKRHMVVKGCDKKSQATSSTGVATNNNSNKTATSSNASKPNKKLKISSASSISLSTNNNKNTFNGN
ncbi:14426_t:CDS:2 [Entrophospora sp. SA101]|nr:14426_t:CDS:2 [Entrophospora sp. SA101]CAJ0914202.1 1790_t:CDS:2 [Entrophospora sp. SA101]